MAESERLDERYLAARQDAINADEEARWAQMTGPATPWQPWGSGTGQGGPPQGGKERPKQPTEQLPPEAPGAPPRPAPTPTIGIRAEGTPPYEPGKTLEAIPPEQRASLAEEAVGLLLKFPQIGPKLAELSGATPVTDLRQYLIEGGVPPEYIPEHLDAIEPYLAAVHGLNFKGKKMTPEARTAAEVAAVEGTQNVPREAPAAAELLSTEAMPDIKARVNINRVGGSDTQKAVIANINKLNVESGVTGAAVRGVVGHEETIRVAKELIESGKMDVETLLSMPAGTFLADIVPEAQALAARNLLKTSGDYIVGLAQRIVKGDVSAIDELYEAMAVHGELDPKVMAMTATAGRVLDIHNVISQAQPGVFNPAALSEIAERLRMGITLEATAATGAPPRIDPIILAQMILNNQTLAGRRGVNTFVRQAAQAKGPGFMDMLYEGYMGGLLSNPETDGRNTANNLLKAIEAIPMRKLASTMSRDPEGVVSGEATGMLYALLAGWGDAMRVGWQSLRAGQSQFGGPQKFQRTPAITGAGLESASRGVLSATGFWGHAADLVGVVARVPGRLLTAADDFAKVLNYRMELQALAVRDGVQQGKTGTDLAQHIAATVANPPAVIHAMAQDFAFYNTLNAELTGRLGRWLQAGQRSVPGFRWIEPFLRIQANITKTAFEYIPGLNLALDTVRADLAAGGARRDMAMAKMAAGSLTLASAAGMAAAGQLTGSGPVNAEQNAIWRRTHQPYSFKFLGGDTWYSYQWMGPLAMILALPATMVEMGDGLGDAAWDQLAMAGALATGEIFLDQTWSKGLFDVVEAFRHPENKGLDYVRTFARSFVPGIVGEFEKVIDPTQAQTKPAHVFVGHLDVRGHHIWEGVDALLTQWAARVPGWSSTLEPSRDVWGNVQMQSFGVKDASEDPVDQELMRLRIGIRKPSPTIYGPAEPTSVFAEQDRPNIGVPLTDKEYSLLVRLAGNGLKLDNDAAGGRYGLHDALAAYIKTPAYKALSDDPDGGKAKAIQMMAQKYREAAKMELIRHDKELQRLIVQRAEEKKKALAPVEGLSIAK